jgi:hypothetical protein
MRSEIQWKHIFSKHDSMLGCLFLNEQLCGCRYYLVFDGDVDALWVEDMNSVMDDNKLLTLPNGERIRVQNHCKLLFEVISSCVFSKFPSLLLHILPQSQMT